jgi:phosphoribosylformimino-5-aminoimidazole carboxamide ribotide isomerase
LRKSARLNGQGNKHSDPLMSSPKSKDFAFLLENFERYGLLLQTDANFPNVVSLVVGERVRGSWWAHHESGRIYDLSNQLFGWPQCLVLKLLSSKLTLIHRRWWPAIYSIAAERAEWQMAGLDGAFGKDENKNADSLRHILQASEGKAHIQFGGGLRSLADIEMALNLGVERVVIGTLAHRSPEVLFEALEKYGPKRIALALDSKNDQIQIEGWTVNAELSPQEFVQQFQAKGLEICIFTNILRDGLKGGIDLEGTVELARSTGLSPIASGGVASVRDVEKVREANLSGVIVGRALYDKKFTLQEVLSS